MKCETCQRESKTKYKEHTICTGCLEIIVVWDAIAREDAFKKGDGNAKEGTMCRMREED